jgi:type VI secretion system secreted protein VgrG
MPARSVAIRLESDDLDTSHIQLFQIDGKEAISRLFSFDLRVVTTDPAGLDASAWVGSIASVVFELREPGAEGPPLEERRVHGMIAEIEDMLDPEADHRTYRLRLVPRAYRSTLIETQEVFLDQTIPQIMKAKLARVGLEGEDVQMRLLGEYPPREFVVQYKETDLAFVSRLAEHLGIAFHFEHGEGRDVMVFTDDNSLLPPVEGDAEIPFHPRGEVSSVHKLSATTQMIPATYVAEDYNYMTPDVDLTGRHELPAAYAGGVVEYGPNHLTPAQGGMIARVRAEERQATLHVLSGASDLFRFHAGEKFTLEGHPRFPATQILLVEVEHHATQSTLAHGGTGERAYRNTFRAIDAATPYRPPRLTPKPRIAGYLSARVEPGTSGAPGNYAELDDQGRYTVRFFWDPSPLGARPFSSMRVRMAQPHAGPSYGHHFPLKPGIEVVVAFAEGDPDRPVILGAVPNPITPSPVTQPSYLFNKIQTASGIFMEMKDV